MSWDRPFSHPVPLPEGPSAQTLRDVAGYIRKLSQPERDCPEWRLAVQMLIDAAEDRGPMLFAHMGIVRALEMHDEAVPAPVRQHSVQDEPISERTVHTKSRPTAPTMFRDV